MAFVESQIENGVGRSTAVVYAPKGSLDPIGAAETYLNLGGKLAYSSLTGNIGVIPKKEVYAVKATRYVEGLARERIMGWKVNPAQALLFPRSALWNQEARQYFPIDDIAARYLEAVWEAYELAASGEPLDEAVAASVLIEANLKRKKTDVLEKEWFAPTDVIARDYEPIAARLDQFLGSLGELVRA